MNTSITFIRPYLWFLILTLFQSYNASIAAQPHSLKSAAPPDTIEIREPGLHPEAVVWDSNRHHFLISSFTTGSVTTVQDDGTHQIFATSHKIKSAIGLYLDKKRDRLLVAGADFSTVLDSTVQGEAKLIVYDLSNGEQLQMINLANLCPQSRHLANNITVDPKGNAYITDSFSPVIYRVTPEGKASVFAEDPRFGGEGVGLNGITYDPKGFLLVAMSSDQTLYRVPLRAPDKVSEVKLPRNMAIDGMALRPNGNIVVAIAPPTKRNGGVIELTSKNNWQSAKIAAHGNLPPMTKVTNVTLRAGTVYAVNPHIFGMINKQKINIFEVFRVNLR